MDAVKRLTAERPKLIPIHVVSYYDQIPYMVDSLSEHRFGAVMGDSYVDAYNNDVLLAALAEGSKTNVLFLNMAPQLVREFFEEHRETLKRCKPVIVGIKEYQHEFSTALIAEFDIKFAPYLGGDRVILNLPAIFEGFLQDRARGAGLVA